MSERPRLAAMVTLQRSCLSKAALPYKRLPIDHLATCDTSFHNQFTRLSSVDYFECAGKDQSPIRRRWPPKSRHTFVVEEFHTWALKVNRSHANWEDETLEWYCDGQMFFSFKGNDVGDGGDLG